MRIKIFDHMEECTPEEVQRMLPLVSAQRREHALRYAHTFGQYCCLKSWLILEEMTGAVGEFEYNAHGKPFLKDGPFFSISHCKDGIAVAVDDAPIGIDIESIRHVTEDLIERTMNEHEREGMEDRAFTRLWTRKEAIVKAEGVGIESFEQLQTILDKNREWKVESFEKENYIYSIAYGKLHCFSA